MTRSCTLLIRRRIDRNRSLLFHPLLMTLHAQDPSSSLTHILLNQHVLPIPLTCDTGRDGVLRLTHLVGDIEEALSVEVPLHEILDLRLREVRRSTEILHLLYSFVVDLSSLDPQIAEDLILDFRREVTEETRVDVEIFRSEVFDELTEFFFGRDTRVGGFRAGGEGTGEGGEGVVVSKGVFSSGFGDGFGGRGDGSFEIFEVDGVGRIDDVAGVEVGRIVDRSFSPAE